MLEVRRRLRATVGLRVGAPETIQRAILTRLPGLLLLSAASTAASGLVGFIAAARLGPDAYGQAQGVLLAYAIATLGQVGAFAAAQRAAIDHRAMGEVEAAATVERVGITVELMVSLIPGLALAVAGLVMSGGSLTRYGFILAPVVVIAVSLAGFLGGLEIGDGNAVRATKASAAGSLASAFIVVTLIWRFGGFALIVAPLAGSLPPILWLGSRRARAGLRPQLVRSTAWRLIRSGLPLAASGVVYWLYRWVGPAVVGLALGATALGVYSLANAPILLAIISLSTGAKVALPRLWTAMTSREERWQMQGDHATSFLTLAACLLATGGQLTFPWLIDAALPRYTQSIPVMAVLAFEIPLFMMGQVPSMVLDSTIANRQARHLAIWTVGLVANVVVDALLLWSWHAGIVAVAWADVAVQVLVVGAVTLSARVAQGPLWGRRRELLPLWIGMGTCAAVGGVVLASPRSVLANSAVAGVGWLLAASLILWHRRRSIAG